MHNWDEIIYKIWQIILIIMVLIIMVGLVIKYI